MKEGPSLPVPEPEQNTWNQEALAQALGSTPSPIEDAAFGPGLRFALPGSSEPNMAIYPDTGVLRVATHDAEVTLYHVTPPTIAAGQVVFERKSEDHLRHLSITGRGEVTLLSVPREPASVQAVHSETGASLTDEEAYLRSLETAERPGTVDEYGFDDGEMRRLLNEGLGGQLSSFPPSEPPDEELRSGQ
jgi:hypothetical protein